MPRQPRLDAPETLHHVMAQGIKRTTLFRDDTDRADFVTRVGRLVEQGAWTVSAWAPPELLRRLGSDRNPPSRTDDAIRTKRVAVLAGPP